MPLKFVAPLLLAAGFSSAGATAVQDPPAPATARAVSALPCMIGSAEGVAEPEDMVRALYGTEQGGGTAVALLLEDIPMTPRLAAAFCAEEARMAAYDEPIGRIDFDWVVNGQDALITDLAFDSRAVFGALDSDPERMVVDVTFANFDTPQRLQYFWENHGDGWRLAEVASLSDQDRGWVLSLLLDYG